jgi:hypothetical protein
MSVILATQEVEMGELWFEDSSEKKRVRPTSQTIGWVWWHHLSYQGSIEGTQSRLA